MARKQYNDHEIAVVIVLGVVSVLMSFMLLSPPAASLPVPAIEETGPGLHWHARLSIYINGELIPIPADVGAGTEKGQIQHTHEWDNVIHMHVPDESREWRTLSYFFDVWGVTFTDDCIFQYCNVEMDMTVNGEPNLELRHYAMRDQDDIVLVVRTF